MEIMMVMVWMAFRMRLRCNKKVIDWWGKPCPYMMLCASNHMQKHHDGPYASVSFIQLFYFFPALHPLYSVAHTAAETCPECTHALGARVLLYLGMA